MSNDTVLGFCCGQVQSMGAMMVVAVVVWIITAALLLKDD